MKGRFVFALIFLSNYGFAQYDVCVYGGTSAGVIAAYTAAKMGKKVILIEPSKHLGGLTSGGLGYTDIGNKYAITGLSKDFYRRTGKHYGKFEQWIFEPHVAEAIFSDYIKEAKVPVLFEYRIVKAAKQNGWIKNIVVENSNHPSSATNQTITAKMFIDCSYEGDLMARAGISFTTGREDNSTYNETWNGVQLLDKHQFPDGVSPYKVVGDSASGLLWGISNNKLLPNGTGNGQIQAYNYRICLTNSQKNKVPVTKPEGYDSSHYELLLRLIRAQPNKQKLSDYFFFGMMPNNKTDINNNGGFSTDMIGENYNYPDGNYDERKRIIQQHQTYTKGLLWFVGNDVRVPQTIRNEMQLWGYPVDEWKDNDHFSPQLYIRESRRMIGDYVMTQANCEGRLKVSDGAGLAAYTMDSHNCERLVVNSTVKNEGDVQKGGFGPYPVSYRALIPKEAECKNVLVPVCLSASHIAYGSIRMEPVFMVLAQSCAVAACMAIDNKRTVQQINVKRLQQSLLQNPLADGSTPEILVDNDDSLHVKIRGTWQRKTSGGYGASYLVTTNNGDQLVTYTPNIVKGGTYRLYLHMPLIDSAADKVNVVVKNMGKTKRYLVVQPKNIEGQTSGEWVFVGEKEFTKVSQPSIIIITNKEGGKVPADAILLIPKR
ncbi:MAG: FAD-dependent oxidoreductase [Bacteroidota bacterium]|nr:FAD-dependent oxidoreductase [Bacteroidota bacterium]